MAVLLHMSDLHLGAEAGDETWSDAKTGVIPPKDRQSRFERIRATLEAVARSLEAESVVLDCIVITGDVAHINKLRGYELLPDLLRPLVPSVVPANRVVVVPGNHDVARGSVPSSPERYEHFATLRALGYVTPLLEGIDMDGRGTRKAGVPSPVLIADDGSFILAALNSANHCWSTEPDEPGVTAHRVELDALRESNEAVKALWEAWAHRGEVDPSWIGSAQLQAVSETIRAAAEGLPTALRLVAMHHQLLPASAAAEIKPYESVVNLGEMLDWVADNHVDVVLHGHKHVGRVAPIEHSTFSFGDDAGQRTLVVSAPTAQPDPSPRSAIARLLMIPVDQPRLAGIQVLDIPAMGPGATPLLSQLPSHSYRLDDTIRHGLVRGATAQEVHRRLLALGEDLHPTGLPLTCHISNGQSALTIPDSYPDLPETIDDRQHWFDQTVSWWQNERVSRAADFNHGQRIYAFHPKGSGNPVLDQLDQCAVALTGKDDSTRAIAILVDPGRDLVDPDIRFPAFVLVQFALHAGRLDVIAYFRKQEIPHWWPINVGELANLQNDLIGRLASRGRTLAPGAITTITTQAVRGGSIPRVTIPSLDRRLDDPHGMLDLVLPLFGAPGPGPDAARAEWQEAFLDWRPSNAAPADGDPIPTRALQSLTMLMRDVARLHPDSRHQVELCEKLDMLRSKCADYESSKPKPTPAQRNIWITDAWSRSDEILKLVDSILPHAPSVDS